MSYKKLNGYFYNYNKLKEVRKVFGQLADFQSSGSNEKHAFIKKIVELDDMIKKLSQKEKRNKARLIEGAYYYLEKGDKSQNIRIREYYRNRCKRMLNKIFNNERKVDQLINAYYKMKMVLEMRDSNNPLDKVVYEQAFEGVSDKVMENHDPYYLYSGIKKLVVRPLNGRKFEVPFNIYKYKDKNKELRGHWVLYWDKHDNSIGIDLVPEYKRTYVSNYGNEKGKGKDEEGNTVLNNEKPDFRKRNRFYLYDLGKFTTYPYTFDLSVIGAQDNIPFVKKFKYKAENSKGQSRQMGIGIGYKNKEFAAQVATNRPPKQYIEYYKDEDRDVVDLDYWKWHANQQKERVAEEFRPKVNNTVSLPGDIFIKDSEIESLNRDFYKFGRKRRTYYD